MELHLQISEWLKEYLEKNYLDTFVVGVSGGIDSAVTSALCATTNKKTILITMPIHQNPQETTRGQTHINWLKNTFNRVESLHIDLTLAYEELKKTVPTNMQTDLSLANTRARIRMTFLYMVAGSTNGIVVGTGNKVEDFGVGFYTKYGDGGVDISPIADCTKTQVWEMGKNLGILDEIIKAQPTDGLWDDGRTDVGQLGMSYQELEKAMKDPNSDGYKKYIEIRKRNLHKMKPIPVCKMKND